MSVKKIGQWDEMVLNAYVDGELDRETMARIDVDMEVNPKLGEFVKQRMALNERVFASCDSISDMPLSPGLQNVLNRAERGVPQLNQSLWKQNKHWLSLAAGIGLLSVGFVTGYFTGELKMENHILTQQLHQQSIERELENTYSRVLENTPSGKTVKWVNEATSTTVELMPIRTLQAADKRYCREFKEVLVIGEEREVRHGISCREGKATWKTRVLFPNQDLDAF